MTRLDPTLQDWFSSLKRARTASADTGYALPDGTLTNPLYGISRPYIWVRFLNDRAATRVINTFQVNDTVPGTAVKLETNAAGEWEIVGLDGTRAPYQNGAAMGALATPVVPAEFNTQLAYGANTVDLRVRPTSPASLSVYVQAYNHPNGAYLGETVDLTSVESGLSTSRAKWVLIYVNESTNAASYIASAEVSYEEETSRTSLYSSLTANQSPAAFVYIEDGTTAIIASMIYDARWHFRTKDIPSFTLAGDSGTSTIASGDTLTVAGSSGVDTAVSGDTVTVSIDIPELTEDTSPDGAADFVMTYDASATALKKVLLDNLPGGTASYYQTLKNNGVALTQRAAINAIAGTNITFSIVDDAVNNESDWTINATSSPGGGAAPSICEGRLTLTSGTPVTTSDVTAATTLYFTPFRGSYIGLYSGSAWELLSFSELSLSLSGLLPHSIHDVFVYNNAGTPTLELTAWTAGATGSITGATNATPIVITSTAHGLSTNDIVTITGVGGNTAANGTFRVTSTGADTFSLQTLAGANVAGNGAYTSGGTWYKSNYVGSRATALTTQNGIYVKSGATTRRYLGTIRITSTSGQTEDSVLQRYVWNYYNRTSKPVYQTTTAGGTYSYSTSTYRASNNDLANRIQLVCGVAEQSIHVFVKGRTAAGTGGAIVEVGYDSYSTEMGVLQGVRAAALDVTIDASASNIPSAGYHFYSRLEWASGSVTWYTQNSGIQALWVC